MAADRHLQTGRVNGRREKIPGFLPAILFAGPEYTHSETGALYLANGDNTLSLVATYALPKDALRQRIETGEGIAGQAYKGRKMVRLNHIEEKLFTSFSGGQINPNDIVAFPIYFEGYIIGVIELATIHSFKDLDIKYLENISNFTGISLNTARNRARLKELLEETQSQSEELQAQHRELENMNAELEVQAEKLQTSEEELKVQQEELMETNQELEERSQNAGRKKSPGASAQPGDPEKS